MNIYEAIKQMHELTRAGRSFSFSFMTYSYDKNKSNGTRCVQHAMLLPSHARDSNKFAEFMLRYRDMDTYEEKHFWYPLLLEFNGCIVDFK